MTLTAAVVRELVAAGLTGDALVAACDRIEGATLAQQVTSRASQVTPAALRMRRYRERQRTAETDGAGDEGLADERGAPQQQELSLVTHVTPVTSQSVTCDVKKEIPHTPLEKTITSRLPKRARKPRGQGTRLPPDFTPLPQTLQIGRVRGLTDAELADQLERFRDWANAATGQVGVKRDWQAAFRNWVKRVADERSQHRKSPHRSFARPSAADRLSDAFAEIRDGLEGRLPLAGHRRDDGS